MLVVYASLSFIPLLVAVIIVHMTLKISNLQQPGDYNLCNMLFFNYLS